MIGIIGYGRFGRLTARYLAEDFKVYVHNRSTIDPKSTPDNVHITDLEQVCRQDYLILAVPISGFQAILKQINPLLKPGTIVIDVCSVKVYPVQWMKALLPDNVSILATHPMFGPDSAAESLVGMKLAYCNVRLDDARYQKIKSYLKSKNLMVIETSPEDHDRQIAITLALTHFIGRSLSAFGADQLQVDTEGYKRLLHILEVVENDTWQLFLDMNRYNPYAREVRNSFIKAMRKIDRELANNHFD